MSKVPDELGALWEKIGAKGPYMTGTFNGQSIVVFRNDSRVEGSQQPHWRILKARPKGEAPARPDPDLERLARVEDSDPIPF